MSHVRWFTCTDGWPKYLSLEKRDGRFFIRVSEWKSEDLLKMEAGGGPYEVVVEYEDRIELWRRRADETHGEEPDAVWHAMQEIPAPVLEL